jgi:hypothetical protein
VGFDKKELNNFVAEVKDDSEREMMKYVLSHLVEPCSATRASSEWILGGKVVEDEHCIKLDFVPHRSGLCLCASAFLLACLLVILLFSCFLQDSIS